MSLSSRIEWTEATWNPVTGCTKVSDGCKHCYAERMAFRLQAMGNKRYRDGFAVRCHPELLSKPSSLRKPTTIFVNSMSDLFHPEVPTTFIRQVFDAMASAPWHTFQVLTKRAERLAELAPTLPWPPNIWIGVTVESQKWLCRIDSLRLVEAHVRFVSFEPLLTRISSPSLKSIGWVIVGGESGPGARSLSPDWVRELRDTCGTLGVPFFFKQWGGLQKKKNGRELDGITWDERPALQDADLDFSLSQGSLSF